MHNPDHIQQAIYDYADHHEIDPDRVEVTRVYDEEGNILAIWLSLDVDDRSHGCDETVTFEREAS